MPYRSKMVWLVRHAETEWSASGKHTSRTNLPLLPSGEARARELGVILAREKFDAVLTSPRQRAQHTAELAGFGARAQVDEDLREWDYGQYEGLTSAQIHALNPAWDLWSTPCPGGEPMALVAERCRRVIARVEAVPGNVLLFSHGHFLKMLAALWLNLPESGGCLFGLKAGSISVLGYEHERRVMWQWDRVEVFAGH